VLVAVYPVLFVAAYNTAELPLSTVLGGVLVMAAVAMLAYGIVVALTRRVTLPRNAALLTALVLIWLLYIPILGEELRGLLRPHLSMRWRYLVPGSAVLLALAGWRLVVARLDSVRLFRLAASAGTLLVLWSVVHVGTETARQMRVVGRSPAVYELLRPLATSRAQSDATAGGRPDVYIVILDEYANDSVLKERFDYDNGAFEDSLRALGFVLPSKGRSNYADTAHSLASMLNLGYLDQLAAELGPAESNAYPLRYLIRNNRLFTFFQQLGYRTYYVPSAYFGGTQNMRGADAVVAPGPGPSVGAQLAAFVSVTGIWQLSLPGYFLNALGYTIEGAGPTLRNLSAVDYSVALPGPKFVFAHVMLTHMPFHLDASCSPHRWRSWPESRFRDAYLAQVRCTNRVVLRAVTDILARAATPPIIILQADHGTSTLLRRDNRFAASRLTPAQSVERFGAFGAYFLPSGGSQRLGQHVTPVTMMRYVCHTYFDARLDPLPNDSYFNTARQPFRFTPVADSVFGARAIRDVRGGQ
jgi:hypothetical protein